MATFFFRGNVDKYVNTPYMDPMGMILQV